ncbi:MAG: tetratricopeptide repeat protein [Anaerolineales bacterium]|nr:tetratricopeptide repeat protein [Anaerolineales bacterium]MBP6209408.1 tetratricopeptide repeat protein [Anaerolineales bacterium]MBP8164735.1 tetratricopeptide repeat protein [Anaerolineales bacterium]
MTPEPAQLAEQGKQAFMNRNFDEAAELFRQAAEGFTLGRSGLLAAEMKNNLSVALLQAGKPQESLDAVLGTDKFYEGVKDVKSQAMALGNMAAALEGLKRYEEALTAYERSAELFAQVGEGDLRAMVIKSAAAIKLKTGKVTDSAFKMMGSLEAKDNPGFFERILKFFLRFIK